MADGWRKWRRKQLNQELVDEIAGHFRKGATLKIAAGLVAIPPGVLRMWLREGEAQLEEIYESPNGYPEHEGMLYLACAEATAAYLAEHVGFVSDPAGSEWRNSSWLLERRDEDFNPASKMEVTGADGGPIALEGRGLVGLADVVQLAKELGAGDLFGLDGGDPPRALPSPDEVLPDPAGAVEAASAVPTVQGS